MSNAIAKKTPLGTLKDLLASDMIKKRFDDMLGARSAGFVSSIISSVSSNQGLLSVDPNSVISSALIAASLDLPINQNLGFAYIVPYKGIAQFQMGWKGFVQLAIRTGQYSTIHASEVYEDELRSWNPLMGEFLMSDQSSWSQRALGDQKNIVGYVAFFRLSNGFEKYLYMTKKQVDDHAKKYSQSYASSGGRWKNDFNAMALKTVIKLLLSKFGILSIELQNSIKFDQAKINSNGEVESYPDAINIESSEIEEKEEAYGVCETKGCTTKVMESLGEESLAKYGRVLCLTCQSKSA
jgi:recombination protein RecT